MNNINEIFDAWRKFTNFLGITDEKPKKEYKNDLGVFMKPTWDSLLLVLYTPVTKEEDKSLAFNVIGGIYIKDTEQPCIGPTMQVSNVYVDEKFAGQGYGPLIYGMAFLLASKRGSNLTSDQKVGTKTSARGRWDKMISRGEITSQKTKAGNDHFDYTGKETPDDPQDNCEKPTEQTATDQSWKMKNTNKYAKYLYKYGKNHETYEKKMKKVAPKYNFKEQLFNDFADGFHKAYNK